MSIAGPQVSRESPTLPTASTLRTERSSLDTARSTLKTTRSSLDTSRSSLSASPERSSLDIQTPVSRRSPHIEEPTKERPIAGKTPFIEQESASDTERSSLDTLTPVSKRSPFVEELSEEGPTLGKTPFSEERSVFEEGMSFSENYMFRIFSDNSPLKALDVLKEKEGWDAIDECRCIGPFSRTVEPDAREIAENGLVDFVGNRFDNRVKVGLTIIGSGGGFQALIIQSKFAYQKGFRNVSVTLVDPIYSTTELGKKTLKQFKQITGYINQKATVSTLDSIEEVSTVPHRSQVEVFVLFDAGQLGMESIGYKKCLQVFEGYLKNLSCSVPVIYLTGTKLGMGIKFNKEDGHIKEGRNVHVGLQFSSPKEESTNTSLLDYDEAYGTSSGHIDKIGQDYNKVVEGLIKSDDYDGVKHCIQKGVNPNKKSLNGIPLFHDVFMYKPKICLNALKALVEGRADVNLEGSHNYTALHYAVSSVLRNGQEVVEYLISKNAYLDPKTDEGRTPLMLAAAKGHLLVIMLLVNGGANVNLANAKGVTPLHSAGVHNYPTVVEFFCDQKGIEIEKEDAEGFTPLMSAAEQGSTAAVRILVEKRALINPSKPNQETVLHKAVHSDSPELIKSLHQNGAKLDVRGRQGMTPLHRAAVEGCLNSIKTLIELGANKTLLDGFKFTPLRLFKEKFLGNMPTSSLKHKEIIEMLTPTEGKKGKKKKEKAKKGKSKV
jgi:ankyrin repeat protein